MGFSKYAQIIERIDQLIRTRQTGTPQELAKKLNISRRWVYEYIEFMKGYYAPIVYNKHIPSYIYDTEGRFKLGFEKKV